MKYQKCQRCGELKVSSRLREIENGEVVEIVLCNQCYIDINLSILGLVPTDDKQIEYLKMFIE